jgi:hypothetical protein
MDMNIPVKGLFPVMGSSEYSNQRKTETNLLHNTTFYLYLNL